VTFSLQNPTSFSQIAVVLYIVYYYKIVGIESKKNEYEEGLIWSTSNHIL